MLSSDDSYCSAMLKNNSGVCKKSGTNCDYRCANWRKGHPSRNNVDSDWRRKCYKKSVVKAAYHLLNKAVEKLEMEFHRYKGIYSDCELSFFADDIEHNLEQLEKARGFFANMYWLLNKECK